MLDLSSTVRALAHYDANRPSRQTMLEDPTTAEELAEGARLEAIAVKEVCEAFAHDTRAFNSRNNCMLMEIWELRKLVREIHQPGAQPSSSIGDSSTDT